MTSNSDMGGDASRGGPQPADGPGEPPARPIKELPDYSKLQGVLTHTLKRLFDPSYGDGDFERLNSRLPALNARGLSIPAQIRAAIIEVIVARRNHASMLKLRKMDRIWGYIAEYSSPFSGCSMTDYLRLYEHVRAHKPKEILELGTGISTLILAQALLDNVADGHEPGRITSMEEEESWHQMAVERLPEAYRDFVDILYSPKIDGTYKIFRGVQYAEIPDRPYDFVFSDGPVRYSPVNGDKLFDLDLIQIIAKSERPIRAIVDNHYLTFYVVQQFLGPHIATYKTYDRLMYVRPATSRDVRYIRKENFIEDLRLFGRVDLKLRMQSRDNPG